MLYVLFAVVFAAISYAGIRYFVKASRRYGGARVIICPETHKQAMVDVDVGRAALTALVGQEEIRLEHCWRWPLRKDCGQECLLQLDVAPNECLVRSVLLKWYRGKRCVFCLRPFGAIELTDHKPSLLGPAGEIVEWSAMSIEEVEQAMQTHQPVCWNCQVAQTFRQVCPDLVVERPSLEDRVVGRIGP